MPKQTPTGKYGLRATRLARSTAFGIATLIAWLAVPGGAADVQSAGTLRGPQKAPAGHQWVTQPDGSIVSTPQGGAVPLKQKLRLRCACHLGDTEDQCLILIDSLDKVATCSGGCGEVSPCRWKVGPAPDEGGDENAFGRPSRGPAVGGGRLVPTKPSPPSYLGQEKRPGDASLPGGRKEKGKPGLGVGRRGTSGGELAPSREVRGGKQRVLGRGVTGRKGHQPSLPGGPPSRKVPLATLSMSCGDKTYEVSTGNDKGTCTKVTTGDSVNEEIVCKDDEGNRSDATCKGGCLLSSGSGSCKVKNTSGTPSSRGRLPNAGLGIRKQRVQRPSPSKTQPAP